MRNKKAALVCAAIGALVLLPGAMAQVAIDGPAGEVARDPAAQVGSIEPNQTYPRSNYFWPYASGPDYSLQADASLALGTPGVMVTQVGAFRVGTAGSFLPAELRKSLAIEANGGAQYFILQMTGDDALVVRLSGRLERLGGRLISHDPNSRVAVAKVTPAALAELNAGSGVVAFEPFHPGLKLNPSIGRVPLPHPIDAVSEIYALDLLLFPGEDVGPVASALTQMGGAVRATVVNDFPQVAVEIHRSKLAEVAALEPVMLVLERLPWMLFAEETTTTMQTGGYNRGAMPFHDAGIDGGGGGASYGFCSGDAQQGCTTVGGDTCPATSDGACTATNTAQVLMVIDNGIQLDAGDLSNTRTDAGWTGTAVIASHRKVIAYEEVDPQFGVSANGDVTGCDLPLNGGKTHGHAVASVAVGNATNVSGAYGAGWVATDQAKGFWSLDGVAKGGKLIAYDAQVTPAAAACQQPINTYLLQSPQVAGIFPGDFYVAGGTTTDSSLEKAYSQGARSFNISMGNPGNAYNTPAVQVDNFLAHANYRSALVYIAAGNQHVDNAPANVTDKFTLTSPATAKNALAIGASGFADRTDQPSNRAFFSGTGPAVNQTTVNRIAPLLMAPGFEDPNNANMGLSSEFHCRSNDADSSDPVECDIAAGNEGTSFSSAAAAGAGMLVRDYFGLGFYPTGARDINRAEPDISGALVKAVLVASADFMEGFGDGNDFLLNFQYRFNYEQGYGRIQLDNALPLETWPPSPGGLIVVDRINGTLVVNDIEPGGDLDGNISNAETSASATFTICNDKADLRVVLAWVDPVDSAPTPVGVLVNDLNLTLVSPSGIEYRGNYFNDDGDRDGNAESDEDCPGIGGIGLDGLVNAKPWSLPVCPNTDIPGTGTTAANNTAPFDDANNTEAIFLSPNADGFLEDTNSDGETDSPTYQSGICTPGTTGGQAGKACGTHRECAGTNGYQQCNAVNGTGDCCEGGDLQTEPGTWTVTVTRFNTLTNSPQDYALVIAGGVCIGSSVSLDKQLYTCNDKVEVVVAENNTGLTAAQIAAATVLQVVKADGTVVDEETIGSIVPIEFIKDSDRRFAGVDVVISAGTTPDSGNGVLDVNDEGDRIRAIYTDGAQTRTSIADVNCAVDLTVNAVLNIQFGQDAAVVFFGGCERNVRGKFELAGQGGFGGSPDRYLDADEFIQVDFIVQHDEDSQLESVDVELSCVIADADSPLACQPDGTNCTTAVCSGTCDPRRANNPSCDGTQDTGTSQTVGTQYMTIVDPKKNVGIRPELATFGTRFSIKMAGDGAGEPFAGQPTPTVELLLYVSDRTSGKPLSGVAVNRLKLNVDAVDTFYSTDFPQGGTQVIELNDNEVAEDPVFEYGALFQGPDGRFETKTYANLLVGKNAAGSTVNRNQNLRSPWNFDANDGGFRSGLAAPTDEVAVADPIYNWGEDENFNGIEDGHCGGDAAIRCFNIGAAGSDARCAHLPAGPPRACLTDENRRGNGSGFASFSQNWSTRGGCGWQTRAPSTCSLVTTRGCFNNTDCNGVCYNTGNSLLSTFSTCNSPTPTCGSVWQCGSASPVGFDLKACGKCSGSGAVCFDATNSTDCPAGQTCNEDEFQCDFENDADNLCALASQTCQDAAGACTGPVGNGGVWHTGVVNSPTATTGDQAACSGPETTKDCQSYGFIGGTGQGYEWWNMLLTPKIEKVNQQLDSFGAPVAGIEITNWMWNLQIDHSDNNVNHTWEIDTDTSRLLPADLTADDITLGEGRGRFGAVTEGSNPALQGGWNVFAPMGTCGVKNCGGRQKCVGGAAGGQPCSANAHCTVGDAASTCASSGSTCSAGICSGGTANGQSCSGNADCGHTCSGGAAAGQPCNVTTDCTVGAAGSTCTGADAANKCEKHEDCIPGGCSRGLCDKGKCNPASCSPAGSCNNTLCSGNADCLNAPGQTGAGATCDLPFPNTVSCANNAECDASLGVPGATCIGVGSACIFTDDCVTKYGTTSACTLPVREGCRHVPNPGSESPCSNDLQCAPGVCTGAGSPNPCHFDADCTPFGGGSVCGGTTGRAELCASSAVSVNGDQGNSRVGKNACYFQGTDLISLQARNELGLAKPSDNDRDDDLEVRVCAGNANKTCSAAYSGGGGADGECVFKGTTGPCCPVGFKGASCLTSSADGIDEYVTANGPKRNFDLIGQPWNGPDLRLFTLEDIYGDTGNTFQGALGFVNLQGKSAVAQGGFGHAIDDMVIEWREFTLAPDATDCAAGSCATLLLDTDREFIGEGVFTLRVMDQSPYGFACSGGGAHGHVCFPADSTHAQGSTCPGGSCVAATNDCDGDGVFFEAGVDDNDCNNNSTADVVVLVKSEAEPLGELIYADLTSTGVYEGSFVATSIGDSPAPPAKSGVLFLAQIGTNNPTIIAQYFDYNDGAGDICENTIVQATQGVVADGTVIFFDQTCPVTVAGYAFADNGDIDDFLDSRETATVNVHLSNKCAEPLTNCIMRLTTNSPDISCIQNPSVAIPLLPCSGPAPCTLGNDDVFVAPGILITARKNLWRCNDAAQTPCDSTADCPATFSCVQNTNSPPTASFTVTLRCDQIDGLDSPQSFAVTMDLDIVYNTADQTTWFEGFENSNGDMLSDGGTKFVAENNDNGIPGNSLEQGLANAQGWRCQYADPDWENSNSSGNEVETNCFPSHQLVNSQKVFWRIDGQGIPENLYDQGRAKAGVRSMYYGVYDQTAANGGLPCLTTPEGTIEGVRTTDPINLGVSPVPVLSWWHQISLIDERRMNVPAGFNGDRGIVQLQLADNSGSPIGDWIKLVPTKNKYEQQAFPNFFNCQFDPIDDGSDEDDFFDPTDPGRVYGPSSTCFGTAPGFVTDFSWGCIGDTDGTFNTDNVCKGDPGSVAASDAPSWPPNPLDASGTWLESRVDLSQYKGRRVRVRYLVSGTKVRAENYELTFKFNPDERDDGWWIDDVTVNSALLNPASFAPDPDANAGLPACGSPCSTVTANVTVASEPATCNTGVLAGQPCKNDAVCAAATAGSECRLPVNPVTVTLKAPGQPLELNALGADVPSVANACFNGGLQFRFKKNAVIVRDFTENPVLVDAPLADAVYDVTVRCSSVPACNQTRTINVEVTCPSTGLVEFWPDLKAVDDVDFEFDPISPATNRNPLLPEAWQMRYGSLADLKNGGNFSTSVLRDGANISDADFCFGTTTTSSCPNKVVTNDPNPQVGRYFIFARDDDPSPSGRTYNCNEQCGWTSGGAAEVDDGQVSGNRDSNSTLPAACP